MKGGGGAPPGAPPCLCFYYRMETSLVIGILIGVLLLLLLGLFVNGSPPSANGNISCRNGSCKIGGANGAKVVLFYADWCGYCQQVKPIWRKLENEFPSYVTSVDVDLRPNLKTSFNINGFPTIVYAPRGLDDPTGVVVYEGARDEESFRQFINENI